MYNGKSIESMNFDDLRSFVKVLYAEVQEISGLLARTKRQYDDMLYNLSRENISVEFINEQEGYINSTIKKEAEAFDAKLKEYSTIEQTEDSIVMQVGKSIASLRQYSKEELDGAIIVKSVEEMTDTNLLYRIDDPETANSVYYCYYPVLNTWVPIFNGEQQKYSTVEQTAEKIEHSATSVIENVNNTLLNYSTTEQTSEMIRSTVKQEIDNNGGGVDLTGYTTVEQTAEAISQTAYRGFSATTLENAEGVSSDEFMIDQSKLYYISNGDDTPRVYYAFNTVLQKFMPIIDGQSIYTVFKQTTDGFEFKGNVLIDASLIAKGMLKGIAFADISETGYLNLVSHTVDGVAFPAMVYEDKNGNELFKVLFDGAGTTDIYLNGTKFGYIGNNDIFRPVGTWDFTNTSVEGLGVVPVFG